MAELEGKVIRKTQYGIELEILEYENDLKVGERVKLKPIRRQRTINQNSYFHLFCGELAKQTHNSLDTIKEILKREFLSAETEINGVIYEVTRHTSSLDKKEFSDFMKKCIAFSYEFADPTAFLARYEEITVKLIGGVVVR